MKSLFRLLVLPGLLREAEKFRLSDKSKASLRSYGWSEERIIAYEQDSRLILGDWLRDKI